MYDRADLHMQIALLSIGLQVTSTATATNCGTQIRCESYVIVMLDAAMSPYSPQP